MTSIEVEKYLMNLEILHQTTAKTSSLNNGRVERYNRCLNEFLRTQLTESTPYFKFEKEVKRAARVLNITPRKVGGVVASAHERVFKFPLELDKFKPVELREEYEELCRLRPETWGVGFKTGTKVLVRNLKVRNKLSERFHEAEVESRVSTKTYTLKGHPGKFDLKDLRPLPVTEYEELSAEDFDDDDDDENDLSEGHNSLYQF